MANQMGAAPSLHDAASLHDSYMRSTSPCATHTCPTRLLAYAPHIVRTATHIVRTANGRAPVTACSTHVERRLRAGCGSAEDRPAVPERVLPLSADSSALAILYREDTASQPPCASRRRRAAAAAARARPPALPGNILAGVAADANAPQRVRTISYILVRPQHHFTLHTLLPIPLEKIGSRTSYQVSM